MFTSLCGDNNKKGGISLIRLNLSRCLWPYIAVHVKGINIIRYVEEMKKKMSEIMNVVHNISIMFPLNCAIRRCLRRLIFNFEHRIRATIIIVSGCVPSDTFSGHQGSLGRLFPSDRVGPKQ